MNLTSNLAYSSWDLSRDAPIPLSYWTRRVLTDTEYFIRPLYSIELLWLFIFPHVFLDDPQLSTWLLAGKTEKCFVCPQTTFLSVWEHKWRRSACFSLSPSPGRHVPPCQTTLGPCSFSFPSDYVVLVSLITPWQRAVSAHFRIHYKQSTHH